MQKMRIRDILQIAVIPFVVFIVAHTLNRLYNEYDVLWWPNVLFHFLGGFSMAISGNLILIQAKNYKKITTANIFVDFILLINFVLTMAVLWEIYELISDTFYFTHSQISNFDTMKDIIMGGLGAMFFCLLWLLRRMIAGFRK